MQSEHEFTSKVIFVTGASKGIGAGVAKAFGAAGAKVGVGYGQDRDCAAKVVAQIEACGGEAVAVQGDLRSSTSIDEMINEAIDRLGPIHTLVNNAGAFAYYPLEQTTEETYRSIFDVNVLGLLLTTKVAVARFDPAGGNIINISSLSALGNAGGRALYSGSKAAVNAITKVLALELAPRSIRVNAIMPGYIDTEGARSFGIQGTEQEAWLLANTPIDKRPGKPSEIASVALFLASEASGWVTGEIMTVSGGLR